MSRPAGTGAHVDGRAEMAAFASALRDEMGEVRAMVRELLDRPAAGAASSLVPDLPEEFQEYYTRLIQNEVAEEIAREVIAEARDRLRGCRTEGGGEVGGDQERRLAELVPEVLVETIERMLPEAEPIQLDEDGAPRYVALVGPTGVGKTTTVAKLAAHFKLREGKRVGLITVDTYRIAAVEQLRTYANILNVPLQVVMTPEEMASAVASSVDCDLVLIDTSGRSQRDSDRLEELKLFLDAARRASADLYGAGITEEPGGSGRDSEAGCNLLRGPDGRFRSGTPRNTAHRSLEVHLVLSCAAHPAQLLEAAERFGALGVDRVAFTKLDEAVGLGVMLNVIRRLNLELSYLTTGQDVPDDIEIGHRRRIAELVLGRRGVSSAPVAGPFRPGPAVDHVA